MTIGQAAGVVVLTVILMVPCGIFIWYPAACLLRRLESVHHLAPAVAGFVLALSVAGISAWSTVFHGSSTPVDCHAQYDHRGGHLECD